MSLVQTFFCGMYTDLPATNATHYNRLAAHGGTWSATAGNREQVIPTPGTFTNLRVELDAAPGTSKSRTGQLYKNGVAQGTGVVISDAATSGTQTEELSLAAGDVVEFRMIASGSPAAAQCYWAWDWIPDTDQEGIQISGNVNSLSTTATVYNAIGPSNQAGWTATYANFLTICPTAGTWSDLFIDLSAAPGSGKSFAFTVLKNGVATALTTTVSDTATTASDTSNSFTCIKGDEITIRCVPSGTPASGITASHGTVFVSDTADESLHLGRGTNAMSTTATEYNNLGSASSVWSTDPSFFRALAWDGSDGTLLKKFMVKLNGAPAFGGSSYTFSPAIGAGDPPTASALTVTIAEGATTGEDFSNTVTVAQGDIITMMKTVSATAPASRVAFWGLVQVNIATASGGVVRRIAGEGGLAGMGGIAGLHGGLAG